MTYATQNDLIDRVGERLLVDLTDREDARTNSIDADAVAQALAHADAEIDGYLVDRYVLPLTEVPPTVIDIACILAICTPMSHRPRSNRITKRLNASCEKSALAHSDCPSTVWNPPEPVGPGRVSQTVSAPSPKTP